MGTPGVPFEPNRQKIVESIKKHKGVVTHMCKELHAQHGTLIKYINNDPELKQMLLEARHAYAEELCDYSEEGILYTVKQREDLSSCISAAKFVLNNIGRKRGYSPIPTSPGDERSPAVEFALAEAKNLCGESLPKPGPNPVSKDSE